MCGIGAILDPAGTSGQHAAERMVEALRHRGPDGEALRRIGPVALAHTRLAIIDVAGGDQPLDSEDGNVTAIVNGEIYNHRDLRAELEQRGHRWATNSDSEVVVHAYEEHGVDCVRRLNGIFAFVIWDEREQRLVAARDAFGVKPLYWWTDGRRVALASEIGALIARRARDAGVDRVALDHYLACRFVPAPRTLFEGISKLPAASTLVVEAGRPRRGSRAGASRPARRSARRTTSSPAQLAERVRRRRGAPDDVRRPVRRLPLGGVDSAGVVAAMKLALRHAADHVHDRLPRPRRRGRRARAGGRERAHHRHGPPRHGDARDRLPRPSCRAACPGSRSRAASRARRRCSSCRASPRGT